MQAALSLELSPEAAAAHTAALSSLAPRCGSAASAHVQDWGQALLGAAESELHHAMQASVDKIAVSVVRSSAM